MIEQVYRVAGNKEEDASTLQKALEHIHATAAGFAYLKEEPTAKTVPFGQVCVYDNGSGTKRLYVRTGEDSIGYVTLT